MTLPKPKVGNRLKVMKRFEVIEQSFHGFRATGL